MYHSSLVVEKDEHSVLAAIEGKVSRDHTDREEDEKLYECANNPFKIDLKVTDRDFQKIFLG